MTTKEHPAVVFAVEWLDWLQQVRELSTNTLKSYNLTLRQWLKFCIGGGHDVFKPTNDMIDAFVKRKHERVGVGSAGTRRLEASIVRSWYKWLYEREKIKDRPALDGRLARVPRRVGRPVPDEDWQVLWGERMHPRLRACLGLGFYVGLRPGEVCALRTAQLTPTRIVRFVRKGGDEQVLEWLLVAQVIANRMPGLLPDVRVLTEALSFASTHYEVLGRTTNWLYRQLQNLCRLAGVPDYTPHQLRHSAATNLLRAGVREYEVQRIMGHASFDTTMGYVGMTGQSMREILGEQGVQGGEPHSPPQR